MPYTTDSKERPRKDQIACPKDEGEFTVQKKVFFIWVGLDACDQWDFFYSKIRPKIFNDFSDIIIFLDSQTWSVLLSSRRLG